MSKADMMFKKLGYDRREELYGKSLLTIKYYNSSGNLPKIIFDKQYKNFRTNVDIDMKLLYAINEKCKELRMDGGIEYGRYKSRRVC